MWRWVVIVLVVALLGWGIYDLLAEKRVLTGEVEKFSASLKTLEEENQMLAERIEYFKRPENLLKELKSQFNYRSPDEKLIIVIPGVESTSTATSTGE